MRDIKELNKRLLSLSLVLLMLMAMVGNDVYVAATAEEVVAEASAEGGGEESGTVDNSAPAQESALAAEPASGSADAGAPNNIEGTGGSDQSVDQPATTDVDGQSVDQPATAEEGQPANTEGQSTDQTTTNAEDQSTVEEGQPTDPASEITENPTNTETTPESENPSDTEETEDTHTAGETYYEIITNEDGTQTKVVYEYVTDEETGKLIAVEKERVDGTFDENGDPVVAEEEAEEETHEEGETYFEIIENEDGTQTKIIYEYVLDEETGKLIAVEKERITGTFDADGNLIEEECEHEYEYVSNGDGTHVKRCIHCGEEITEECTLDEDGVCTHCGYEDERLVYQEFTRTFYGTKVVVSGMMPRGATVDILYVGTKAMEEVVNNNLEEGAFVATAAYNINIYRRSGEKYQPQDDGNTVKVSFLGLEELEDKDEEEVTVYRIEEDYTITEIESEIVGEDVYFDAEHFTTYVTGTRTDDSYMELETHQTFSAIATAGTTTAYTKVLNATFDIYVTDKSETYSFSATSYKNLTSSSDPTSGDVVSTGTYSYTPSQTGWQTIEIPLTETVSGNGYVASGKIYSIVVEHSDNVVNLGYGFSYDGLTSNTYLYNTSNSWTLNGTLQDAFYLSASANASTGSGASLELTDTPSDSYTVASVTTAQTIGSDSAYHYTVGDTDTATAVLSNSSVERTISWTTSDPSIVSVEAADSMTATITAVAPGTATITATYKGYPVSITIKVLGFLVGTDTTFIGNGATASYSADYTSSAIKPDVEVYSAASTVVSTTTSSYPYVAVSYSSNTNAGTATATVKYKLTSSEIYTYTVYFTINALNVSTADSNDETAFTNAVFTISSGSITAVSSVNTNSALAVTPVYNTGFTATLDSIDGLTNKITITGIGNFTGETTVEYKSTDISSALTVELSSNSRLKNCYYTGKEYTLTEVSGLGWSEVTFYNTNGNEVTGVVKAPDAAVTIYDYNSSYSASDYASNSTKASPITAGKKALVFSMNSGGTYTGSIMTTFTIQQADMSDTTIIWTNGSEFAHTGKAVEPKPGTDFKVYLNYVSPADTGVLVYTSDDTSDNTSDDTSDYGVTYQGDHVKVTDSPKVVVTGTGVNFDSSTYQSSSYTIVPNYALDLVVRISEDGTSYDGTYSNSYATGYSKYYDGTTDLPNITVRLNGALTYGTHYSYAVYDAYTSSTEHTELTANVGTKYIVVTGLGDYADEDVVVATYEIAARPLTSSVIKTALGTGATSKVFTGVEMTWTTATSSTTAYEADKVTDGVATAWSEVTTSDPDLKITYGSTYLKEGTDFTINYGDDCVNVGTVSPVITGKGNYTGSISSYSFTITQATLDSGGTVSAALAATVAYTYDGTEKTPSIVVTIGTTFSETYTYDSTNLSTDNYTVSYANNISPGTAQITVTGKNNLTGSAVVEFTISASSDEYSAIYIGGSYQANISDSSASPREYTCSGLSITYTGSKYAGRVVVYGVDSTTPLTRNVDYSYSYKNATNANEKTTYSSDSPYLLITGLGNYANNNAIVYFNIAPRSIDEVTISGLKDSYDWESGTVQQPELTLTYNGNTLEKGTDYTIAYYDTYVEDGSTNNVALTAAAGTKTIVIKGNGNYTGTKTLTYTVGTSIEASTVTIVSHYYSTSQASDDIFVNSQDPSITSKDEPWSVEWRCDENGAGVAPVISILNGNTAIDPTYYTFKEVSKTIDSYNARKAGSTDTKYNLVTCTVTGNEEYGYYGSITFYYQIEPVDIDVTGTRMSSTGETNTVYTGSEITATPSFHFAYSTTDTSTVYDLVAGTDFTPESQTVGTNVTTSSVALEFTGTGNFTGTQKIYKTITRGYVQVWYSAYSSTDTTNQLIATSESSTLATIKDTLDTFTYTGEEIKPTIVITDISGNTLTADTDYTITYSNNIDPGTGTITIVTTNSNLVSQTITVTFTIATNSIENFTGTLSDITYAAVEMTPAQVNTYVDAGTSTLTVKSGNVTLTKGTDFAIVTDSTELTSIQAISAYSSVTAIQGSNNTPSYGTNWIFVKGIKKYSGYLKITFNIVLDLSDTAYAQVYIAAESYELGTDGAPTEAIAPVINYRKVGESSGTYTGKLDNTTTVDSSTVYNYTISRSRDTLPGPDEEITVTGQYACKNSATDCRYNDGTTSGAVVYFLASLSNYKASDLSLSGGTVYEYTGSAITVTVTGDVIDDATYVSDTSTSGDYTIVYTQDTSNLTSTSAIEVGTWYAVVVANSNSKYFISGSNTGSVLSFKIKYNLSNATIAFYDNGNTITSTAYTGSAFSILDSIKITAAGKTIYHKGSNITNDITITPDTVTQIGSYTVNAVPGTSCDTCYGSASAEFTVDGISLETYGKFSIPDASYTYIGSAIKPTVTGTVTVNSTKKTLTEGVDFKVTYYNNTNVGTATIGITGLGSYASTTEFTPLTFEIDRLKLSDSHVSVVVEDGTYSGYFVDPTSTELKVVELEPEYAVYYIDTANGIKNKLQEQTTSTTTGDWKVSAWNNNTKAADSTDSSAPTLTVTAGDSGNTTGTTSGTFTINQLNLASSTVEIAQNTAEYTGSEINVSDVVKLTTTYTDANGNEVTIPLVQKGSNTKVSDSLSDYNVTITQGNTNYTNGKITDMGTYSITITGINSCTGSITTYFTITERSLSNNFHYYYDSDNSSFVPKNWDDCYDSTNKCYTVTDSSGTGLQITINDVEVGANDTNKPTITVVDQGISTTSGSTTTYKTLKEGTDYTISLSNNTASGSAEWNKDGGSDTNATVVDDSPAITITGMGNYTDSITLPYNIGKNIQTLGLTITYTANGTNYIYDSTKANEARFAFTYNAVEQVPSLTVYNGTTKLVKNRAYTVSYTNADGDDDASINAGEKYVVIKGTGDYCGTIKQKYAITRKQITATGGPYTNESAFETSGKELTFAVTGNTVSRLTTSTAKTYLYDTKLLSESAYTDYVGFYYAIYNGSDIEPSVTVTDNTLGSSGTTSVQISSTDLEITYANENTVSTFTTSDDGNVTYTYSDVVIGFTGSSATDYSTSGNYYVADSSVTYHIRYFILQYDISDDFSVTFSNGSNGNKYSYTSYEIKPEIIVENGTLTLTESEDYEVEYEDNVKPGEATMTITGINNYRGSKTLTFYIWGDLDSTEIYYKDSDGNYVAGVDVQQYTGTYVTYGDPTIYLILPHQNALTEDYVLTAGKDYNVTGYSSTDGYITDGSVTYTGLASRYWSGTKTVDYDVEFDADNVTVKNYEESYEYTGYDIIPDFTLSITNATLGDIKYYRDGDTSEETTDFTSLGTISVSIPYSIGNYSGTATAEYEITSRPIGNCKIIMSSSQRYTGRNVKPAFSVYIGSTNLQTNKSQVYNLTVDEDYTVDYGEFVSDSGYLTLTGITDEITGTAYPSYHIKLGKVTNVQVTENTGDSLSYSWTRDIYSDGVELILQKLNDSSVYADYKTGTVTGKTVAYTFSGLSSSTKYRLKIRSYATLTSGDTIYSDYTYLEQATDVATSDISVASNSTGKATITWTTTGDVTLYYIYRATSEDEDGTIVAIIPATAGSFTNSGLTSGSTYYYYVVGYNLSNAVLTKISTSEYAEVTVL